MQRREIKGLRMSLGSFPDTSDSLLGTTKNLTPASSALRADPLGKRFSLGHSTLLLSQLPLGSFLSSRLD